LSSDRRQLLQESLAAIERLEAKLAATERARHEPIAIIGAGCRFPGGVENPEDLWRLLRDGVDAVTEITPDRWDVDAYYDADPEAPGKMVTRRAGQLAHIDHFEPQFFGISPREAATLDPQQRLLLETAHEALESAGIAPDKLTATPTGVFVGISTSDYGQMLWQGGPDSTDVYSATGGTISAAAGRLAFTFGLQGPCVSVDTACSSSLVAIHLACQSLRVGESDLALAGGVNVILSPMAMVLFSRWGMMAPDGACKTFDAAANGYVRSEGCAMLALKRLGDAQAAGDPILGVIRGSAVNSDGRSSGLTVPNGPAQQAVLRKALASARLEPADIDYVEAHGTGTPLGDPIEVEALGAVMKKGRPPERPLMIGSIKTNFGHAEAASGVAGLLKVVMSLRHEAIPRHLHFTNPNPGIPWKELPVTVPTALTPWPRAARPRRAGVSSFGVSGTNAHVILEEAPLPAAALPASGPALTPLSARSAVALRALATRHADFLAAQPGLPLADVAHTAGVGRAHHPHRLAVLADSTVELAASLRSFAAGQLPATAHEGVVRAGERPKVAFLFTGQGAQYPGMGQRLYRQEPVFREVLDRAAALLAPRLPRPLLEVMWPGEGAATPLGQTGFTQPALFALEYALSELWRSRGIVPAMVMGHSVGEYVAACVAGVFSFEEGLALIAERGRLMEALPAGGSMAAVFAAEAQVAPRIARFADRLAIAAVNGPEETVISGEARAVAAVLDACTADGIKSRPLEVSHAFHSPLLDPMLDALERRAASVAPAAPRIPIISNLTGAAFPVGTGPDARYWRRHAREPVRFAAGVEALRAAGVTALVELGPHPTLLALAGRAAPAASWLIAASLRRGRDDERELLASLASLYARGANIHWQALAPGRRRLSLPTYRFQRERHWMTAPPPAPSVVPGGHPLLGQPQRSPQPGRQFLAEIGRDTPAFLADHVILGQVLLPATAYVELGLAAGRTLGGGDRAVQDVVIEAPLGLEENARYLVHVTVEPEVDGRAVFVVRSAPVDGDGWRVHARGVLAAPSALGPAAPPVAEARGRCPTAVDVKEYYAGLERAGFHYGPAFQGVRELHAGAGEAVGLLELAESAPPWTLHPALLDSAFHLLGAGLLTAPGPSDPVYVPIACEEIQVMGPVPRRVWATARLREVAAGAAVRVADLRLEDERGAVVATVRGLQLRAVTADRLARTLAQARITTHAYRTRWTPVKLQEPARPIEGRIVLIADEGGFASALAAALDEQGTTCELVSRAMTGEALAVRLRQASPTWVVDCALDPLASDPAAAARAESLRLLAVAQALEGSPRTGLCLVTRGAQAIAPGDEVDLARAPLLGLGRTIGAERAGAPALRIDLDPAAPADPRTVVLALAGLYQREPELGLRSGTLLAPRLEELAAPPSLPAGEREVLRIHQRGALDALRFEREPRPRPGPGQVEIAVRAAGLNFRDVLNTLGMYPGDAGPLGSECSGVITAVGPGVTGLAVGDEVVACGAVDSFATHAMVLADLVLPKPASLGFADAVTLPITYLTAARSLQEARLQPGQVILVHAAAGGVGLATLRLARRAGLQVIGTAGSPEKRAFVLAEGASHAFDSRSTSFAEEVLRVTGGAGVGAVVNALTGELITAGLRLLRPGGRFIEIGKKGIMSAEEAAARAPGVSYHVVDLGTDMQRDLPAVRALFTQLLADVAAGQVHPLPLRAFPLADAVAAFRYMATARHTGKVVLVPPPQPALTVRADGTYVVTGGLGGLGFAAAEWLVGRGARELLLLGRQGASAADEERLQRLRASGARVTALACDIGDAAAVRALWRDALATRPLLRGIVHAAGTLADAPLAEQTPARFAAVAGGKLDGAWHLHEAAGATPLDFFALFSSSSALFGSPGQANYAAANAFLDGLAAHRRARGQAATSIAWGAWAEIGMAARMSDAHRNRWTRAGLGLLDPAEAFAALERALPSAVSHVAVVALDPARITAQAAPAVRALFGAAGDVASPPPASAAPDALAALRASVGPRERQAHLRSYVHQEAARVLGFNASTLDPEAPLSSLGFDSLMAVQFRNRVEADLAIEVSLVQLLAGPTVAQLADELSARLGGAAEPVPHTPAPGGWEEGSL
jgi:acyl transferase domain-containing protein/aryl carrier-like protein